MSVVAWVGQRECENCGYTGPETEFGVVGLMAEAVYFVNLDEGVGANEVTCCKGCMRDMGEWSPDFMLSALRAWVA